MFYASIYFQNHFEKSKTFKTKKQAKKWLDFEASYTDNVRTYKLYSLRSNGWALLDEFIS